MKPEISHPIQKSSQTVHNFDFTHKKNQFSSRHHHFFSGETDSLSLLIRKVCQKSSIQYNDIIEELRRDTENEQMYYHESNDSPADKFQ